MMNKHTIASARYLSDDTSEGAPVEAILENGTVQTRRNNDDIEGGGMLAFLAEGGTISPYVKPPVSKADIQVERNRRITAGFTWGGNEYQTDEESQKNITGALALAVGAAFDDPQNSRGTKWIDDSADFSWRTTDNQEVTMTAAECRAFCKAAMVYKTKLIKTASAIKSLPFLPADFEDDTHWPSRDLT